MKTFRLFLWVIATSLAFAACSDDDDDLSKGNYKVTVTADANGTAVADPAEAEAGAKVTLKATASEGFSFAMWTVESGTVTLADATAAETSFTMPKGDVVIRASFAEGGAQEIADILPLLKDPKIKAYVQYRMNTPEQINGKNNAAWDLWNQDVEPDGKFSSAEAAKVTAINLAGNYDQDPDEISLEDLQYFPNLEVLILNWNDVQGGVEVFTKLSKLIYLDFSECYMPDGAYVDLRNCSELATANFYSNFLTKLDVSNCPKLAELDVEETGITELDLTASTMLTHLNAVYSGITSLDVSHCKALQQVTLNSCPKLAVLKLPANSRLTSLNVSKTEITTLDATQHPNLTYLGCGGCPNLTSLDVTNCTKLKTLICQYSPIGKLDLSKCSEIITLYATCCRLTEINLKGCTKLFDVYCEHNNLTEIDATDLAFFFDDKTNTLTNTYSLYCGEQVPAGKEPGLTQDFERKYDEWDAVAQKVTVFLRPNQMEFWNSLKAARNNFKAETSVVN